MKKVRFFAVSDVHGFFTEMKKSLDGAGFNPGDDSHYLVVCGDCFDRGYENVMMYEYLTSLPRKILCRGNHERIMYGAMRGRGLGNLQLRNRTDGTLREFLGTDTEGVRVALKCFFEDETLMKLYRFISGMCDYFETEKYIFTHGWLPLTNIGYRFSLNPDWRYAKNIEWDDATWCEWYNAVQSKLFVKGKKIVCGHRPAMLAQMIDPNREKDDYNPYITENVAAIDSYTVKSGKVNVLVLEDYYPESATHEMKLARAPFDSMRNGTKCIEMRLYDDKRRRIHNGDRIIFSRIDAPSEKITAYVEALYIYSDFTELARDFCPPELGYGYGVSPFDIGKEMNAFYSAERLIENQVVGIRVRVCD